MCVIVEERRKIVKPKTREEEEERLLCVVWGSWEVYGFGSGLVITQYIPSIYFICLSFFRKKGLLTKKKMVFIFCSFSI